MDSGHWTFAEKKAIKKTTTKLVEALPEETITREIHQMNSLKLCATKKVEFKKRIIDGNKEGSKAFICKIGDNL